MAKGNERRSTQKQEQRAAQREAYQRQQRRKKLLLRGAMALVVLVVAGAGYDAFQKGRLLDTVTTSGYAAGQHVAGKITWKENPPMGGAHNVAWQNCGIYNAPVHSEHAVHSMEHGAVWITYRPDLPADQVQQLVTLATNDYVLLSPYTGLPAPVVASAWNRQIRLDGASDPRLAAFVGRYRNNPQNTPEFGASCGGSIGTTAAVDTLTSPSGDMTR
jgi:hypothetical protein